VLIA
jgi:hypothetical protein